MDALHVDSQYIKVLNEKQNNTLPSVYGFKIYLNSTKYEVQKLLYQCQRHHRQNDQLHESVCGAKCSQAILQYLKNLERWITPFTVNATRVMKTWVKSERPST